MIRKDWLYTKPGNKFPEIIQGNDISLKLYSTKLKDLEELMDMKTENLENLKLHIPIYSIRTTNQLKSNIRMKNFFASYGEEADYGIYLNDNNKLIGGIKFVNTGDYVLAVIYYIDKNYKNQGYISKALTLSEAPLSKIGFKKIELDIMENNKPSISVAKKCNYELISTKNNMHTFEKDITNLHLYNLKQK